MDVRNNVKQRLSLRLNSGALGSGKAAQTASVEDGDEVSPLHNLTVGVLVADISVADLPSD